MTNSDGTLHPLVSICCIAYNQKDYIRQALDSFLAQITAFDFEIIIHDDASVDGTAEIIREYANMYPKVIHPVYQTENCYAKEGLNFQYRHVFPRAKGKYIAFCEGDDYWSDPLKLQKQVDIMEMDPQVGLVHARAIHYHQAEGEFGKIIGDDIVDFDDLIWENRISNLTVCLRKELFDEYQRAVEPLGRPNWTTCDFPIWLWMIKRCRFVYLDEVVGVYRIIKTSICHHSDHVKRLHFHEGLNCILDFYLQNERDIVWSNQVKSKYMSATVGMYFLCKDISGVRHALKLFWVSRLWLEVILVCVCIPFSFVPIIPKGVYYIRNLLYRQFPVLNRCRPIHQKADA